MMERYAKYKDSGIAWLGEIPEHWKYSKLKFETTKIIDGAHFTPTYVEKGIPFLRVTDIQSRTIDLTQVKRIPEQEHKELSKRCNPEKGDVLLSKNGTIGITKVIDWDWEFSIFVSLCLLKFKPKLAHVYFSYFFDSNVVSQQITESSQTTSVTNLHLEKIKELLICLPPLEEQKSIATYLDHKTAEIDELIAQKQRLIALYEEEKTAIINEAVTKGINPDVKLKSTAIDWLGDIPEHWSYSSLKYLAFLTSGGTPDRSNPKYWNGDIPWLKTGEITYNLIQSSEEYISEEGLKNSSAKIAKPGTILMAMYGQGITRGRVAILGIKASFNQATLAIIPNLKLHTYFLYHYLISAYQFIRDMGNETSQMNLSSGVIGEIKITLPPLEEQKAIAEYIEKETARIDAKIAKTKRIIELQKEYRTALISEAVTGKVKVPDLVS